VWCKRFRGVSSRSGCCVESGHEFAVGGAGCGEVFVAFVELLLQVEVVLFELVDALVEGVDVGRGAEPGLAPGVLAEGVGEPTFQVLDSAGGAGRRVRGRRVGTPAGRRG